MQNMKFYGISFVMTFLIEIEGKESAKLIAPDLPWAVKTLTSIFRNDKVLTYLRKVIW